MISLFLRLVPSGPLSLRRARRLTLAGALAFWTLLALALASQVPRGAVASATRDRRARAMAVASEMTDYLADRLVALRFVAKLPEIATRGPLAERVLKAFAEAHPEFSRVYVADGRPSGGRRRPLYLSARIPNGFVVGLLKPDWTDRRFDGEYPFRPGAGGARTLLVLRSGARSATNAAPPAWDVLQKTSGGRGETLAWGGQPYVTAVARLGELPKPRPVFLVVSSVPLETVLARAARIQRLLVLLGLAAGVATGLLGGLVLGWATRWLRSANRELEERVAVRTTELAEAERAFRGIFEHVPLGLYQCDPDGTFLRVNPTLAQTLGHADPEGMVASLGTLRAVGEAEARAEFMARLREAGTAQMETVVATGADGRRVWLDERARAVRDEAGEILLIEGAIHDVTAQRELEARLRRLGETDPLTGLPNRRGLDRAVAEAEAPVSFVALDLDRFKAYNDAYGHPAGDHALRTVAEALRLTVRGNDAVARVGGEEFVAVLPRTGASGARRVAEALRAAVAACGDLEIRLTASAGVATAATRDEVDEAMGAADRALYRAKEAGRDRVVVNPAKLV